MHHLTVVAYALPPKLKTRDCLIILGMTHRDSLSAPGWAASSSAGFELVPFRPVEASDRVPDHLGLALEFVRFHRQ